MAMRDFRKCVICGQMFDYQGRPYCAKCSLTLEEAFVLVRDYLDDNPGAPMGDILEATEVKEKAINQLMKEGRLTQLDHLNPKAGATKACMMCKKAIPSGNLCRECSMKTASMLSGKSPEQKDFKAPSSKKADADARGSRMYTRDDR